MRRIWQGEGALKGRPARCSPCSELGASLSRTRHGSAMLGQKDPDRLKRRVERAAVAATVVEVIDEPSQAA